MLQQESAASKSAERELHYLSPARRVNQTKTESAIRGELTGSFQEFTKKRLTDKL